MPAEIDVGRVVAGKYELVRLIGKGAMGEVWLTTHRSLGGEFAIKLVTPSDDEDAESAAGRFQLEAQISAKLSRKTRHIISVSDHGEEEDGLAYLVMELLEGESLESRIKHGGVLPLVEMIGIVMQVARALGQAHAEGIFHRDLKPANIFLTKDEDGRLLVKLLDFGIARSQKPFRTRSPFATAKDMVLGTPSYMSPEQARGLDTLDHRCDLWALAVVAYESLTRKIPWEGSTVEDIFLSICTHRAVPVHRHRPDLPPEIHAVFRRAFASSLSERFGDAAALSQAFEALADPMMVEAAMWPPGGMPSPSTPRLRNISEPDIPRVMAMHAPSTALSDSTDLAVGGTTGIALRKRSTGALVAIAAALTAIGIVIFAVTFGARTKVNSTGPKAEAPAAPPVDPSVVAPPPEPTTRGAPVATTVLAPPPKTTATAHAITHLSARAQPVTVATPAPTGAAPPVTPVLPAAPPPTPPPPPTPATTAPPTPPATTAPPPTPATTAPPKPPKPPDKSEVF